MQNNTKEPSNFINYASSFFEEQMPQIKQQPQEMNLAPQFESNTPQRTDVSSIQQSATLMQNIPVQVKSSIFNSSMPEIIPQTKTPQLLAGMQGGNEQSSVTPVKTESINKTELNINDIFNKNKEILTLEEKAKNNQPKKTEIISTNKSVDNSFSSTPQQMSSAEKRDPLELLKLNYRSLPSWRTQFG